MKSKKIYYILIFNLFLFVGLNVNFYLKSQTGKGIFYGISTWWNEVNSVKDTSTLKLMSLSSDNQEDPLEKLGLSSVEIIKIGQPEIALVANYSTKDKDKLSTDIVDKKTNEENKNSKDEKKILKTEDSKEINEQEIKEEVKKSNLVISNSVKIDNNSLLDEKSKFVSLSEEGAPLCINYGPLNIEQKSSFNILLAKYNVPDSFITKTEDDLYEIIWNLGKHKEVAVELFEKQKNEGALQDVRFKLKQDNNGNYVVPISTIAGNLSMANKMVQELKNSSQNIGGIWEYRSVEKGYFYQIPDIRKLDSELVNTINQVIDTLKTTCS